MEDVLLPMGVIVVLYTATVHSQASASKLKVKMIKLLPDILSRSLCRTPGKNPSVHNDNRVPHSRSLVSRRVYKDVKKVVMCAIGAQLLFTLCRHDAVLLNFDLVLFAHGCHELKSRGRGVSSETLDDV